MKDQGSIFSFCIVIIVKLKKAEQFMVQNRQQCSAYQAYCCATIRKGAFEKTIFLLAFVQSSKFFAILCLYCLKLHMFSSILHGLEVECWTTNSKVHGSNLCWVFCIFFHSPLSHFFGQTILRTNVRRFIETTYKNVPVY